MSTIADIQDYIQSNYIDNNTAISIDDSFVTAIGCDTFLTAIQNLPPLVFTDVQLVPQSNSASLFYKGSVSSFLNVSFLNKAVIKIILNKSGKPFFYLLLYMPAGWKFSDCFSPLPPSPNYSKGFPEADTNILDQLNLKNVHFQLTSHAISKSSIYPGLHKLNQYLGIQAGLYLTGPLNSLATFKPDSAPLTTVGYVDLVKNTLYLCTPFTKQTISFDPGQSNTTTTSPLSIGTIYLAFASTYGTITATTLSYQYFAIVGKLMFGTNPVLISTPLLLGGADLIEMEATFQTKKSIPSYTDFSSLINPVSSDTYPAKNISGMLPASLQNVISAQATSGSPLSLAVTALNFCIQPSTLKLLYLQLSVTLNVNWPLLQNIQTNENIISVEQLNLTLYVGSPFSSNRNVNVSLSGRFLLGTKGQLLVQTNSRDWYTYCHLVEGTTIDLKSVFSYFGLDLSAIKVKQMICDELYIGVNPDTNEFGFDVNLKSDWELFKIGTSSFGIAGASLSVTVASNGNTFNGKGRFAIGNYLFVISGEYTTADEWTFAGMLARTEPIQLNAMFEQTSIALGKQAAVLSDFSGINLLYVQLIYNTKSKTFDFWGSASVQTKIGFVDFKQIGFTICRDAKNQYARLALLMNINDTLHLALQGEYKDNEYLFSGNLQIDTTINLSLSDLTTSVFDEPNFAISSSYIPTAGITFSDTKLTAIYNYTKQSFAFSAQSTVAINNPFGFTRSSLSFNSLHVELSYFSTPSNADQSLTSYVKIAATVSYDPTNGGNASAFNFGNGFVYFPNQKYVFGFSINAAQGIDVTTLLSTLLEIQIDPSLSLFLPTITSPPNEVTRIYYASDHLEFVGNDGGITRFNKGFNIDHVVFSVLGTSFLLSISSASPMNKGITITGYTKPIKLPFVTFDKLSTDTDVLPGYGPRLDVGITGAVGTTLSTGLILFPDKSGKGTALDLVLSYSETSKQKLFKGHIAIPEANSGVDFSWSDTNGFQLNNLTPGLVGSFLIDATKLAAKVQSTLNAISNAGTCEKILNLVFKKMTFHANPGTIDISINKDKTTAEKLVFDIVAVVTLNVGFHSDEAETITSHEAGRIYLDQMEIEISMPTSLSDLGASIASAFAIHNIEQVIDSLFTEVNAKAFAKFLVLITLKNAAPGVICRGLSKLKDVLIDALLDFLGTAAGELALGAAGGASVLEFLKQIPADLLSEYPDLSKLLLITSANAVVHTNKDQTKTIKIAWGYFDPQMSGGVFLFNFYLNNDAGAPDETQKQSPYSPFQIPFPPALVNTDPLALSIVPVYSVPNGTTYTGPAFNLTVVQGLPAPSNLNFGFNWHTALFMLTWKSVTGAAEYNIVFFANETEINITQTTIVTTGDNNSCQYDLATVKSQSGLSASDFFNAKISIAINAIPAVQSEAVNGIATVSIGTLSLGAFIHDQFHQEALALVKPVNTLVTALNNSTALSTLFADSKAFCTKNSLVISGLHKFFELSMTARITMQIYSRLATRNLTVTGSETAVELKWDDCLAEELSTEEGTITYTAIFNGQSSPPLNRSTRQYSFTGLSLETVTNYQASIQTILVTPTRTVKPGLTTIDFILSFSTPMVNAVVDLDDGRLHINCTLPPNVGLTTSMPVNGYDIEVSNQTNPASALSVRIADCRVSPPNLIYNLPLVEDNYNINSSFNVSDEYTVSVRVIAANPKLSSQAGVSKQFNLTNLAAYLPIKSQTISLVSQWPATLAHASTLSAALTQQTETVNTFGSTNTAISVTNLLNLIATKQTSLTALINIQNNLLIASFTTSFTCIQDPASENASIECNWSDCLMPSVEGTDEIVFVFSATNSANTSFYPSNIDFLTLRRADLSGMNNLHLLEFTPDLQVGTWLITVRARYRNYLNPNLDTDGQPTLSNGIVFK
jgi:hypothetical protein